MTTVSSFGDRIPCGDYNIHSRFREAINFMDEDRLVCLAAPRVGGGPINIVVSGADFSQVGRLRVTTAGFFLDDEFLPRQPVYDSGFPDERGPDPVSLPRNLRACESFILAAAHPQSLAFLIKDSGGRESGSDFEEKLAARSRAAAQALRRGDLEDGARAMRGLGVGLTPSGDDFLAGYIWGLHAGQRFTGRDRGADIARISGSTCTANPLSRAFLHCARAGRYFERLRNLLAVLGRGGAEQVSRRAGELLAVGETSGADTCAGLLAALHTEASLWS